MRPFGLNDPARRLLFVGSTPAPAAAGPPPAPPPAPLPLTQPPGGAEPAPVGLPMTMEVEAEPPPPWQDGPPACAAVTPEGPASAGRLTVSNVARSAAGAATAG